MLNPRDVFDDVSVSAIKHPEVEKRMEEATQSLLANIENNTEEILDKLGISSENELFDNLGAYIVSESTKVIQNICKELTAEDPNPYHIKMSFSGADYLCMTYDRAGFESSVGKYQDLVLKGLMDIKTFPKVVEVELTCSMRDPKLATGEVKINNGDVVKKTIYDAFGPVLDKVVGDMHVSFKEMPDATRVKVVEGMIAGIRKTLLDNPQMVLESPARIYQSYLKYATDIKLMNESGVFKPITKEKLGVKILTNIENKTPTITDVLSGIEFN